MRRRLRERFHLGPEAVKPKDDWLVERLFEQIEMLLSKMETGVGLTAQEGLGIVTLQAQRKALGLTEGRELEKSLPWMASTPGSGSNDKAMTSSSATSRCLE